MAPHRACRFALVVTEGALTTLAPAELRAVLAHVIGPLIAHGIVASQGVAEVKADAEYRSYDREEEYAADRYALELLARLPEENPPACLGMVTLLERLQEQGGTRAKDHPLPAERARAALERCPW